MVYCHKKNVRFKSVLKLHQSCHFWPNVSTKLFWNFSPKLNLFNPYWTQISRTLYRSLSSRTDHVAVMGKYATVLKSQIKLPAFHYTHWLPEGRTHLRKFKFSAKFPIGLHEILKIKINKDTLAWYLMKKIIRKTNKTKNISV